MITIFPDDQSVIHYVKGSTALRVIWQIGSIFPEPLRSAVFGTAFNLLNEFFQARLISRQVAEGQVDIIIQPVPVSPQTPSSLDGFGVPVVTGPMNGGMNYPPGYAEYQSLSARLLISVSRKIAFGLNHVVHGKKKVVALLVANARTRAALAVRHPNVVELVENRVDQAVWGATDVEMPEWVRNDPFRLVYMGRLVNWKAVEITIEALKEARSFGRDVRLDILGDGDQRPALEALVKRHGLDGPVRFLGFLPQNVCVDHLRRSHALILNSLYECGGAVVLEAMSVGIPVIASDWGEPRSTWTRPAVFWCRPYHGPIFLQGLPKQS